MRTALEIFGDGWRDVDVTWLSETKKRVELMGQMAHAETLTFGTACNALIRSLCRVDDVPRQHYAGHRQRFAPLRSGMFTLYDMALATTEWRCEKRWINGYGPACDAVMGQFFGEVAVEEPVTESGAAQPSPDGLRQLLIEIERVGDNALAVIPLLDGGVTEYRRAIRAMAAYAQAARCELDKYL